jgi:assimilatory nitrate reductase catalytic subunit
VTIRRWVRVCSLAELEPGRGVAAMVDGQQVAVFLLPGASGEPASRLRAVDNRDPVSGANVLARGLLGSTGGVDYVASPMHKHRFDLASGRCLDGVSPDVRVWPVRVWGATVEVLTVTAADEDCSDQGERTVEATHCPFCALQCAMGIDGRAAAAGRTPAGTAEVEIKARPDFPVNEGRMCVKGWSSAGLLGHPDRLLHPLVRDRTGALREASWDAALDELASRLAGIRAQHGPDAVGVFGSGALTNEKAYLLGKFARLGLGTANIDYNGRYCMSSAAAAQNRSFGIDRGLPFPVADIADTDTLVLWGANPADTMPPLMLWVERLRRRGGRVVVVDPRRTDTAALADVHLQPRPGTDLAVALGLLHVAVAGEMIDEEYIARRTVGWEAVRDSVADWGPARVSLTSGVGEAELRAVAGMVCRPGPSGRGSSMLITGRGPEQQTKGVDTVTAAINLMLALGQVGRRAGGYGCLTGQGNGQGGREHGQKADQLPGYRLIADDQDRAAVAEAWGVEAESLPGPGLSATEMIQSIGSAGGVRALLVAGSNVAVASPDARRARDRLARLDLLAVLDSFPNETTELADIILPVTQWAEEDGTTTNLEGRVLHRRRAVPAPPGVRSDIEVMCALASRLGHQDRFRFDNPRQVFDELRRVSAGARADYSGITYERLDAEAGVFWPCPDVAHPGSPRLFADRFAHSDGRARFVAVRYRSAFETTDGDYPVMFTTGRKREHYNSGSQTRRLVRLSDAYPEPLLEIHPLLAAQLGLATGSLLVVESRRGSATFKAVLDDGIRADTVFAPFHWGGSRSANLITVDAVDPVSGMPEFKVCAVRVRPLPPGL